MANLVQMIADGKKSGGEKKYQYGVVLRYEDDHLYRVVVSGFLQAANSTVSQRLKSGDRVMLITGGGVSTIIWLMGPDFNI